MKPTPNLVDIEAGVDNLPAIELPAPHITLPVIKFFCPRETFG